MAGGKSIKLFQFNRKYLQKIGIELQRSNQNRLGSNLKAMNVVFIVSLANLAMPSAAFLFNDAKAMGEYCITFYAIICAIVTKVMYSIFIWKLEDMLNFIENCEQFIEKSECDCCKMEEFGAFIQIIVRSV